MLQRDPLEIGERLAGADARPAAASGSGAASAAARAGRPPRPRRSSSARGRGSGRRRRRRGSARSRATAARACAACRRPGGRAARSRAAPAARRRSAGRSPVRVGVVDAFDCDLAARTRGRAARELPCALGREPVRRPPTFSPVHRSSTSTRSVTYGRITSRHDELLDVPDQPRDQLGVVRLLDEVELVAQVRLELVGQRAQLQELGRLRVALERARGRAEQRRGRARPARSIPGRRTLTTTSRPSLSSAAWTCAIEAVASGSARSRRRRRRRRPRRSCGSMLDERAPAAPGRRACRAPRCRRPAAGPGATRAAGRA